MATDKFKDFIDSQTKQTAAQANLEAKKNEWLAAIQELYSSIEQWLGPYGQNISVQYVNHTISEELIGSYKTKKMDIHLAGKAVSLVPVALFIVGAYGRVDMIGQAQIMKLVRLPKDITEFKTRFNVSQDVLEAERRKNESSQKVWKFSTNPPHIIYTDVDDFTFKDALIKCLS